MNIIYFSLSFALLIFVWKNTNVFIDYYNWFNLKGLKWVNDYNKKNDSGFIETFFDYLSREKHEYFFVKLITCPICLSVWSGIFCLPFVGLKFLSIGFLVLFFYYLLEQIKCK